MSNEVLDVRKTQLAFCAAAALGLCLIGSSASAFPAADGSGKDYSQTVTDESATTPVRWAGRAGGWGGRGIGFGRGIGWRGRGIGFGRGIGWRRAGWRGGWRRGGWGGYGWGGPVGLGLGLGATGVGYSSYGGYYGGGGGGCGCGC
jgi:hypothetical protein